MTESPVGWRLPLLVKFLAFEADPIIVMVLVRAESCWHHRHATVRTDRWAVIVIRIHVVSISAAEG